MARVHYEIPDDLHKAAKLAAVRQDMTLRQFVINALEAAVAEDEKPKKK